jgi:arginase family enzyme
MAASDMQAIEDMDTGRILDWRRRHLLLDLGDLVPNGAEVDETLTATAQVVQQVVARGGTPVLLGGSSPVTTAGLAGLSAALQQRVGLIRISSHLDLASNRRLSPDGSTRWAIDQDLIGPSATVFVGVQRYVEADQWHAAQTMGALVMLAEDLEGGDIPTLAASAVQHAGRGMGAVYLSIDADVIDAGFACGTPDIVVGGLSPRTLLAFASCLSAEQEIRAIDFVDVAPPLDLRARTERIAAESIIELLAQRVFSSNEMRSAS